MKNTNKVIEMIFEKMNVYIEKYFGDDVSKEQYHTYLVKKYGRFFNELTLEDESDEMINMIVDECIDNEGSLFESMDMTYKLQTILDVDETFEYLSLCYWKGTRDALKCRKTGIFLHDMEEYKLRLQRLTQCVDNIKPRNFESTLRILLYAILDINFIFKNSDLYSLKVYKMNCLRMLNMM